MRIDNKAIMSIYAFDIPMKDLGGAEAFKRELDYLREVVKDLGYDDLIILACGAPSADMKACGIDGVNAYSWGTMGADAELTKACMLNNMKKGFVHTVPTVSVGYNTVAWSGNRSGNLSVGGMREDLAWCRDTILTRYPQDSWQSKLIMLSTWNEYGEGTYICPAGLNGFGYLDAVRSVFCKDVPHTDVLPDEKQKARINILHPRDRARFARLDYFNPALSCEKPLHRFSFRNEQDLECWECVGFSELAVRDGRLVGRSDSPDPYMLCKEKLPFHPRNVARVVVRLQASKPIRQICCTQLYFATDRHGAPDLPGGTILTNPHEIAPLSFTMFRNPDWDGEITAFRLDPIYAQGEFVLESIEFMAAPPHVELWLDGERMALPFYAYEENGECYFCLDPKGALAKRPELYYEWNKCEGRLTLFGQGCLELFCGKDTAVLNERPVKMGKAFAFADGLPELPLSLFAAAVGFALRKTPDGYELIKQ